MLGQACLPAERSLRRAAATLAHIHNRRFGNPEEVAEALPVRIDRVEFALVFRRAVVPTWRIVEEVVGVRVALGAYARKVLPPCGWNLAPARHAQMMRPLHMPVQIGDVAT